MSVKHIAKQHAALTDRAAEIAEAQRALDEAIERDAPDHELEHLNARLLAVKRHRKRIESQPMTFDCLDGCKDVPMGRQCFLVVTAVVRYDRKQKLLVHETLPEEAYLVWCPKCWGKPNGLAMKLRREVGDAV